MLPSYFTFAANWAKLNPFLSGDFRLFIWFEIVLQVVNGYDEKPEPNNYVYVTRNCQTKPMPVDRNIENLKVCVTLALQRVAPAVAWSF